MTFVVLYISFVFISRQYMPPHLLLAHPTSTRPNPEPESLNHCSAGSIISSSHNNPLLAHHASLCLRGRAALDALGGWSVDVRFRDPALIVRLLGQCTGSNLWN